MVAFDQGVSGTLGGRDKYAVNKHQVTEFIGQGEVIEDAGNGGAVGDVQVGLATGRPGCRPLGNVLIQLGKKLDPAQLVSSGGKVQGTGQIGLHHPVRVCHEFLFP